MASSSIKMSGSAIKVRLMEAEDDPRKQMELLESSSLQQAIGVFGFYGEFRTVGKLRAQHVRRLGKRGHIREFNTNKEGKVIAVDKLLQGCTPKDTSTAALLAWVEKFVVQWAQVEGALAYINLAYTRVLLDRLKDGGSVEPHQLLLEDVCSGNAAALGAEELQQASDFQDELMEVLERAKDLQTKTSSMTAIWRRLLWTARSFRSWEQWCRLGRRTVKTGRPWPSSSKWARKSTKVS